MVCILKTHVLVFSSVTLLNVRPRRILLMCLKMRKRQKEESINCILFFFFLVSLIIPSLNIDKKNINMESWSCIQLAFKFEHIFNRFRKTTRTSGSLLNHISFHMFRVVLKVYSKPYDAVNFLFGYL